MRAKNLITVLALFLIGFSFIPKQEKLRISLINNGTLLLISTTKAEDIKRK